MTDLPVINLPPPAPTPPDPLTAAMREIGPAAMRWFLDVHGRSILVDAKPVDLPTGGRTVVFSFRLAKPGLIPTAIERRTFDAFIAGYRSAINIALSHAEPESPVTPN